MKTFITLALTLTSICSFSQTDIIEMRSRSASLKKHRINESIDSDHSTSNFGVLPKYDRLQPVSQEVHVSLLDSVKCLSDSVAVVYTSNYYAQYPVIESTSQIKLQSVIDTVVNHPLFRPGHSVDSIKQVIKYNPQYGSQLTDSTGFIGFDNAQSQSNENAVQPVKNERPIENSIALGLMFLILTPTLFVCVVSRFLHPSTANSN